jgi:methyl-accepting chemotaxis protein
MFLCIRQSRATSQTLEMKLRTTVCIALVLIALFSAGVIDGLAYVFPMRTLERTAAVLLVVTLSVGAGYWLARQITRPLADVTRAVDAFGSGELTRRCQVNSPQEIAELAHTLNRVAGSINKDIAERRLVEEASIAPQTVRDLSAHLQTVAKMSAGESRDIHDDLGQCLTTLS